MRLRPCPARPSDDPTIACPSLVIPSLPFCRVHYEEYCMLKESEASAIREAERLAPIVEDMPRDSVDEYSTIREIRRDREVAQMYLDAVERCTEAGESLRVRFMNSQEHTPNLPTLEASERRQQITAFLEQLAVRQSVIASSSSTTTSSSSSGTSSSATPALSTSTSSHSTAQEPNLVSTYVPEGSASEVGGATTPEPAPSSSVVCDAEYMNTVTDTVIPTQGQVEPHPSSNQVAEHAQTEPGNESRPPQAAEVPVDSQEQRPRTLRFLSTPPGDVRPQFSPSFASTFEATAQSILSVPLAAFSCPDTPYIAPDTPGIKKCPTMQLTTSKQCTMQPSPSSRLCPFHILTHAAAAVPIRVHTQSLERFRVDVARINIGHGNTTSNIAIARKYISALEELEQLRTKHQETYSCAALDEHKAVMDDLAKRRTHTVLLLAMLKGRTGAVIRAGKQGQEEQWATEYLAEVKRAELEASVDLGGRLTVGAAVGAGLTAFFGGPLGVGAMVGAAVLAAARPEKRDSEAV